jgi:hypothetical protein
MFSRTFAIILAAASLVAATPYDAMAPSNMNTLLRRDVGQINVACSPPPVSSPSGSGLAWSCVCPYDLNGDTGVLINFFPVSILERETRIPDDELTSPAGLPVRVPERCLHVGRQVRGAAEHAADELPDGGALPVDGLRVPAGQQHGHGCVDQPVQGLPVRVPARRVHVGQREPACALRRRAWDADGCLQTGALTNTRQTNCPTQAKCVAPTQS